ncbi:hypothetical protein COCC4DRAFT_142674 [Bipolaris maydis ATCC 48331]|uniref:C2H2-type domain-containing protein n=2 Tax=Cochliobolus heterostrophus TaxID=5016 RepID=M2UII0_COCH5|nr:uncharacterized protein COCC4DRAFT_142674 [Bipolaris maydis ATCC 48331]EMD87742.1 hypothetical protein COCHEDRAFT_1158956 [Bipolaris maydis C5]KAJ6206736.1 hypothetical protein PSV09DRAFT_1158956 [Bipolaris maydis]ENI03255.1 hypothetical protein COCC4DRAFT_142674 [Bipolaris maydis ATCC 48331]KAJ6268733.1 hypothetical protein PSV08DRAFT_185157 [Bipolaris maydis]KAJ6278978.1 hypothetical protein J3E71DRAFT_364375 [Bipolaris maydis]
MEYLCLYQRPPRSLLLAAVMHTPTAAAPRPGHLDMQWYRLSENDGKSRQTSSILNTYLQTTQPTYQDCTGLQNYEEGHSIDSELYWAATSIAHDDTGYIQSFSHNNEPQCANEATANNPWLTQPVVSGFPLDDSHNSTSPFNVQTIPAAILGASTSSFIAGVDHCTYAHMCNYEDAHTVASSFGGNRTQSNPSHLLSRDTSASASRGHAVQRDRVHCTWPNCTKTFGRLQELVRHHNSIHKLRTPFWCPVPSCNRSSSFPRRKRPFSRKDKLDSHMRNMHHITFGDSMMAVVQAGLDARGGGNAGAESGSGRSGFNTANRLHGVGAPSILDDQTLSNGVADFVHPIAGHESLDPDSVSTADWFSGMDGVGGFNAFPSPDQMDAAGLDDLTAADGISDEQTISGEDMLSSGNRYVGLS